MFDLCHVLKAFISKQLQVTWVFFSVPSAEPSAENGLRLTKESGFELASSAYALQSKWVLVNDIDTIGTVHLQKTQGKQPHQ